MASTRKYRHATVGGERRGAWLSSLSKRFANRLTVLACVQATVLLTLAGLPANLAAADVAASLAPAQNSKPLALRRSATGLAESEVALARAKLIVSAAERRPKSAKPAPPEPAERVEPAAYRQPAVMTTRLARMLQADDDTAATTEGPAGSSRPAQLPADVKPLAAGRTSTVTTPGELPTDFAAERFGNEPAVFDGSPEDRMPLEMSYLWEAPALCHGPLYFEDVNLERYGYTHGCLEPAVSAVHFFGTIPLLPYLAVSHPPRECIYTLGYYRPGTCGVPYQKSIPVFRPRALIAEAVAVASFILWIP